MGKLFGTDGIRGEANRHPMDAHMAFAVGQALTYLLKQKKRATARYYRQGYTHIGLHA